MHECAAAPDASSVRLMLVHLSHTPPLWSRLFIEPRKVRPTIVFFLCLTRGGTCSRQDAHPAVNKLVKQLFKRRHWQPATWSRHSVTLPAWAGAYSVAFDYNLAQSAWRAQTPGMRHDVSWCHDGNTVPTSAAWRKTSSFCLSSYNDSTHMHSHMHNL